MSLFFGFYAAGFVVFIISFYKLIDLRDEETAFIVWVIVFLWPIMIPVMIITFACKEMHKILLKL